MNFTIKLQVLIIFISLSLQGENKYKNFFEINAENIEKFLNRWDLNFVYLHSEKNCPFCKIVLNTLSELAKKYNDPYSSRNRFGLALCEKTLICNKFSNKNTPVLLYKIKNEFVTFNKTFSKKNIEEFVI